MKGIESIVKFANLSDENRWNANHYQFDWVKELDEHDCRIISLLDCLRDGEHSGLASATQFVELMIRELDDGYAQDLANDWAEIYMYLNIISYEEFRHGMTIGTLFHFVKHNNLNYAEHQTINDYGRRYLWCYKDRQYWDVYAYLLSHLFAEVVNTALYRDISERVHHPVFKEHILYIMKDEARHTSAWEEITRNLANANPFHKKRMLDVLDRGMTYHNAMVHETYFEGLNKMLELFITDRGQMKNAIEKLVEKKFKILENLFGNDNPYQKEDVRKLHMQYLSMSTGHNRARYTEDNATNIQFYG